MPDPAEPASGSTGSQVTQSDSTGRAGTDRRAQAAARAAHGQVVASAGDPPRGNPPSCTFVAAVVEDGLLVSGWVGDSRAYWLPDAGTAVQLSVDDSWATEQMRLGATREEAEHAPQAHAITRWLGIDAPDPIPRVATAELDGPGLGTASARTGCGTTALPAEELHELLSRHARRGWATRRRRSPARWSTWANEQGGHDNITVALARIG